MFDQEQKFLLPELEVFRSNAIPVRIISPDDSFEKKQYKEIEIIVHLSLSVLNESSVIRSIHGRHTKTTFNVRNEIDNDQCTPQTTKHQTIQ